MTTLRFMADQIRDRTGDIPVGVPVVASAALRLRARTLDGLVLLKVDDAGRIRSASHPAFARFVDDLLASYPLRVDPRVTPGYARAAQLAAMLGIPFDGLATDPGEYT